jgi:hypothetical protein
VSPVNTLIATATSKRGAKAKLARDTGVEPSTVTRWARDIVPEDWRWRTIEESLGLEEGALQAAYDLSLTQQNVDAPDIEQLVEMLRKMDAAIQKLSTRVRRLEQPGR